MMIRSERLIRSALLIGILVFGTERAAYGYTDPGTGALIWQTVVAMLAGFLFYFRRISAWFRNRKGSKD